MFKGMLLRDRVKLVRRNMGLTQAKMAEKLGVSVIAVQNWENGRRAPTRKNIVALADASGVEVDWLSGEELSLGRRRQDDSPPFDALETVRDHLTQVTSELSEVKAELAKARVENRQLRSFIDDAGLRDKAESFLAKPLPHGGTKMAALAHDAIAGTYSARRAKSVGKKKTRGVEG